MGYSEDPKTRRLPPIALTEVQHEQIRKLAERFNMPVASYVRARALGKLHEACVDESAPSSRRARKK
jgi:16S rRNA U516 pseudouridylate synthase RsuA-like enzyme